MVRRQGPPAQSRVGRCTAIKPWELASDADDRSSPDYRIAAQVANQLLRCVLHVGHAEPHLIRHDNGEDFATWRDEPPVYFTTNPSKIYT